MIKNSYNETLDLRVIDVRPTYEKNETVGNLLDGTWHVQTVGSRAQRLGVEVVCTFTVLDEIQGYADTKEELTITYLAREATGVIIGQPQYELLLPGLDPLYRVNFDVAVIPDV